jgi:hypothetical protein
VLTQGKFYRIKDRNISPDICIEDSNGKILFIVEIKLNISGGSKQVDGIIRNFNAIKEVYPDVSGAVIVFNKDSYGPHRDKLSTGWWSHILLEEDTDPISLFFKKAMNVFMENE